MTAELNHLLDAALAKIEHCLAQISTQQIWWRPFPNQNSIGNQILHMTGNLQQWVCCGVAEQPDTRDRESEFTERGPIDAEVLWQAMTQTVENAKAVLQSMTDATFVSNRTIQGFSTTALGAAVHSVSHFVGHAHQIIFTTRLILKDDYRFAWEPDADRSNLPL